MTPAASFLDRNHSMLRHSSRSRPLKLSSVPFCFPERLHHLLFRESTLPHVALHGAGEGIFSRFKWSEIHQAGQTLSTRADRFRRALTRRYGGPARHGHRDITERTNRSDPAVAWAPRWTARRALGSDPFRRRRSLYGLHSSTRTAPSPGADRSRENWSEHYQISPIASRTRFPSEELARNPSERTRRTVIVSIATKHKATQVFQNSSSDAEMMVPWTSVFPLSSR